MLGFYQKPIWISDLDTLLFVIFLQGEMSIDEYKENNKKLWKSLDSFFENTEDFLDKLYQTAIEVFQNFIVF